MKLSMLLLCSLLIRLSVFAQDDRQQVTNAITDYVDAFYTGDTTKILRSISPAVVKYGFYRRKDDTKYEGQPMSFRQMLDYAASVGKRKPNPDKWPKKIELFDCQNQTAAGKLTAWWGTDYILLSKIDGRWMITHVLWQSPPNAG